MSDQQDLVAVRIDEDLCIGVGTCVSAEPETIELGEDGVARPLVGALLPRDRAEHICRECPSGAITITKPTPASPRRDGQAGSSRGLNLA